MRKCIKCGAWHPNTHEFFRKKLARADGIDNWCKTCRCKDAMEYRARVVAKLEADRPNEPVERVKTKRGTTLIRFGDGYKIGSGQKHITTVNGSSSLCG